MSDKPKFKFRPEDYFKTGRSYEMTMATDTRIFKELSEGHKFVNEYDGDIDGYFRTTVICDGFTGDNTEVSFIYYDEEMRMTNHFLLSADILAKSIGLQSDCKLESSDRDDHICLTRIPAESWKGGPTEDCFGSISGNVPSFMLEYVIQKNDDDITTLSECERREKPIEDLAQPDNLEYVVCNKGSIANSPIKKYAFIHDENDEPYFVPGVPYVLACIQDGEFYQRIKVQAIARCEIGDTDTADNMLTELREFKQNADGSYDRVPGWCTLTIATFKEFSDNYTRAWFYVNMYGKMCTFYITADEVMRNIDENAWTFHHDDKKKMGELFWLIKLDRLPALYNMTFINTLGSSGIYDSIVCPLHVIKTVNEKFDTNTFKFGHAYWIQSDYYKYFPCDIQDTVALAVGAGVVALFIGYDADDTYARFIFVLHGIDENGETTAMTCTANYTLEKLQKETINIVHIPYECARHLIAHCVSRQGECESDDTDNNTEG